MNLSQSFFCGAEHFEELSGVKIISQFLSGYEMSWLLPWRWCAPTMEETATKTKKARRLAERMEDEHQADANDLRTKAENAFRRGDPAAAKALLQEASRERRRAKVFTNLRQGATSLVDLTQSIKVRRDLLEVQDELGYHADNRKKEESPGARATSQGTKVALMKQSYEASKEAFDLAVGDDSASDDELDVDDPWVEATFDEIRLKHKERQSDEQARKEKMKKKASSAAAADVPLL
jgi:hypothetical protein